MTKEQQQAHFDKAVAMVQRWLNNGRTAWDTSQAVWYVYRLPIITKNNSVIMEHDGNEVIITARTQTLNLFEF